MIDTPQMYFAINYLKTCGGVQVTASHNPAKYNGFKVSGRGAVPIGGDTGLKDIQHLALAMPHTKGNPTGSLKEQDLSARIQEARPSVPPAGPQREEDRRRCFQWHGGAGTASVVW